MYAWLCRDALGRLAGLPVVRENDQVVMFPDADCCVGMNNSIDFIILLPFGRASGIVNKSDTLAVMETGWR